MRARLSEVRRLQGLGKLRGEAPSVREPRRGSPRYPSGTFQKRGRSEGREVGEVLPPQENARVCPLEGHGGRHRIALGTPHRTPEYCGQQQCRARPQSRDHTPGHSRAGARASTWRLCPVATSYHRTAPAHSSPSAYTAHFLTGVFGKTPIRLFLISQLATYPESALKYLLVRVVKGGRGVWVEQTQHHDTSGFGHGRDLRRHGNKLKVEPSENFHLSLSI